MGAVPKHKQFWTSPYAERVAQTLKPSSMVLQSHNCSQQATPSQNTHPFPLEQCPISEKLPKVSTEYPSQGAQRPEKDCERAEIVTKKYKVSKNSVGELESDLHRIQLRPKVPRDKYTSHKKIRRSPK